MRLRSNAISDKTYLRLRDSEAVVVQSAATIYASYIAAKLVPRDEEAKWIEKAAKQAIALATAIDNRVISDREIG